MLAKKRGFYRDGKEIIRTPLLLPSFSSKGFPHVQNILKTAEELIDGELLVSAYDLHHEHLKGPIDFPQAVFLDSGGYEASRDVELSDIRSDEHTPKPWLLEDYQAVVSAWSSTRPTVLVSYDHPKDRIPVVDQIARAADTMPIRSDTFREILFKPDAKDAEDTNITAIVANIHKLVPFDAVGVTEKEIGGNQQARMGNIARIRRALNDAGLGNKPIHVFGSLDTISTPLYFVAGADIFDGLTWLRFAYYKGMTIYRQNYAALKYGTQFKSRLVEAQCAFDNYYYMKQMQLEMRTFLGNHSFDSFSCHRELIKVAHSAAVEATEV